MSDLDHDEQSRDDGAPWGYMTADGWKQVPKGPLLRAGYGPPPFTVKMPDGSIRRITHYAAGDKGTTSI